MKKSDKNIEGIIPAQYTGNKTGADSVVDMKDTLKAIQKFNEAKRRMLDINNWEKYSGTSITKFAHMDAQGKKLDRKPEVGDYICINIPGPGNTSGDGYDWVQIEKFEERQDRQEDSDFFAFRVRPVKNPLSDQEPANEKPSHFYDESATSTFIVKRQGTCVYAMERGRNELPNTNTDNLVDNIRNTIVATGATLGLSIPQWKALTEGFLD